MAIWEHMTALRNKRLKDAQKAGEVGDGSV